MKPQLRVFVVAGLALFVCTTAWAGPKCGREDWVPTVIHGAKCSIKTPWPPELHGGVYSLAYAMVCTSDKGRWAQSVIVKSALADLMQVACQWVDNGNVCYTYFTDPPVYPSVGATYLYSVLQDGGTGLWSFDFAGWTFHTSVNTDTRWPGLIAQYCGEVIPMQVQLPGSFADKVRFSGFHVYLPNLQRWEPRWPGVAFNSNPSDWGITSVAPVYFDIWDNTP